jgi:hypothetical protein
MWAMHDDDPYGLPRFPGEDRLDGWVDHSRIETRTVRVFTRGPLTAVVIAHPGVWDVVVSDGAGRVDFTVRPRDEVADALRSAAASAPAD